MRNSMVVWVLLSAVLSGCASTKSVKEPENRQGDSHDNRPAAEHLIATDLVNALIQVPALHPQATRLRMLKPEHPFGETLRSVLTASGYPVQLVDSGHGAGFVDYLVTNRQQSRPGVSSTYQVMVGSVGIKRDYRSVNGTIEPASTMFATGVDASMIRTNDGIFSLEPDALLTAAPVARKDSRPLIDSRPIIADNTPVGMDLRETPRAPFRIQVNGHFTPKPVVAGQSISVTLETLEAVSISCYYRDDSASLMRIYPNRFTEKHTLAEGEVITIPSSDAWSLVAGTAGQHEEIFCVSMPLSANSADTTKGEFPDFESLPVHSFDELLQQLTVTAGVLPQSQHLVIPVTNSKGI